MQKYLILGVIMNFAVNLMLILATNRLTGYDCGVLRTLGGALVSAAYAAACMIHRLWFLQSRLWYAVSLLLVSLTAYGVDLRRGLIFCSLRLALDGLTDGSDSFYDLIWIGIISLMCIYGLRGSMWQRYVPVVLSLGQQTVNLTALHDTGNTLMDPVSGQPVLVVDADIASHLTGLTRQQLAKPVETMGTFPGLRLIPYKTVGKSGDFLLALKIKNAKIGGRKTETLVAFAPQELDGTGKYQALIGGTV